MFQRCNNILGGKIYRPVTVRLPSGCPFLYMKGPSGYRPVTVRLPSGWNLGLQI